LPYWQTRLLTRGARTRRPRLQWRGFLPASGSPTSRPTSTSLGRPPNTLWHIEVDETASAIEIGDLSKRVNELGKKKWWIGVNCTWSVNGACWESVSKRQTFSTKQTLHFGSLRTLSSRRSTSLPGFNYMQRVAYTAVQEDNLLFSERNK
jgi:hypothetical protein